MATVHGALRLRLTAAIAFGCALSCAGERAGEPGPISGPSPPGPQPAPAPQPEAVPREPAPQAGLQPDSTATSVEQCAVGSGPETVCVEPFTPLAETRGGAGMHTSYDANGCHPAGVVANGCVGKIALSGPTLMNAGCCYSVCNAPFAPCGRPLLIAAVPRLAPVAARPEWGGPVAARPEWGGPVAARPEWGAPAVFAGVAATRDALPTALRAHLAQAWLADGRMEHASVAAFARFALELLGVGAPPALIERAHRAAEDEVRHARVAFELAAVYGGERVGPGELSLDGLVLAADLNALAVSAAIEGCVGETLAASLLAEQASKAADPDLRAALAAIAADEAEHAELAWSTVAWAIARDPRLAPAVDDAIRRAAAAWRAPRPEGELGGDVLRAHGRLDAAAEARVIADAIADAIEPARAALLDLRRGA